VRPRETILSPPTKKEEAMTFSHLNRTWALATAFVGIACLPAGATPVDCSTPDACVEINNVHEFRGTVTDIGVQRGPGQVGGIEYRIDGKFDYDGPLDLTKSTLTFHNLFDEYLPGTPCLSKDRTLCGNGEMVLTTDNVDLVCPDDPPRPGGCVPALAPLSSATSSKPTEAKYETPARFRPQMRVQIENTNGEYEFNVRLDRGLSPQVRPAQLLAKLRLRDSLSGEPESRTGQFPKLCAPDSTTKSKRRITKIRIRFTIDDGANKPVVLDFVTDWECDQDGRYHLRSR